jgi:hypothetical protein
MACAGQAAINVITKNGIKYLLSLTLALLDYIELENMTSAQLTLCPSGNCSAFARLLSGKLRIYFFGQGRTG